MSLKGMLGCGPLFLLPGHHEVIVISTTQTYRVVPWGDRAKETRLIKCGLKPWIKVSSAM